MGTMSPAKRLFTAEAHASNIIASNATHASTPADLALQLRSVGSRARKSATSVGIFTSAHDVLRDVYSSAPAVPPISPRKRPREDDSDQDYVDTMADGGTVIILDRGSRPVKPKPRTRRALLQTQSLPAGLLGLRRGLPLNDPIGSTAAEESPDSDWTIQSPNASSWAPVFEPMVL
ncbi:hypothetical protein C8J57DRAFT_1293213 [Mycena rebaudengoi]|nr:hypothetical protein C8J57DRAFT_1293213 [Mycena rebaudengoi]